MMIAPTRVGQQMSPNISVSMALAPKVPHVNIAPTMRLKKRTLSSLFLKRFGAANR
jgi:hypothetical protein